MIADRGVRTGTIVMGRTIASGCNHQVTRGEDFKIIELALGEGLRPKGVT